ncbi:MAG: hypothetical protein Q9201_004095 [Fulgogasparrea decipioides]
MEKVPRIIVGIDFGTTYTAAAWADASNSSQIEVIRNWPTAGNIVGSQVPSEIAYDQKDRTVFSWGHNIKPKSHKDILELPLGLNSAEVISDYLSAIYKHVMVTLNRRIDKMLMQQAVVTFALTVPAIWSDAARKKTQEAAVRAGMGKQTSPQIYSEPECGAIHALKDLDDIKSLRSNDRILVCDAGGGTVDIITYKILEVTPLDVVECTVGTGDYCGSTFIDREFEKLFIRRMGSHYTALSPLHRQQSIRNFEATKMAFRDEPDQEVFYVNLPTIGDIEEIGVYSGNLQLTREEMRDLFDPTVNRIIDLISAQVMAASHVDLILLIGGFGESEYLYQRILAWANRALIRVLQPREASTAIVRGAVIKGLEAAGTSKTQITRRARRWYGVTTNEMFVQGKHLAEDRYYNIDTNQFLAKNQIRWFIEKVGGL